jgi:hypothetical protein
MRYGPDHAWQEGWRRAYGYASKLSMHEAHTWVLPIRASFQPVHPRPRRWWLCPTPRYEHRTASFSYVRSN